MKTNTIGTVVLTAVIVFLTTQLFNVSSPADTYKEEFLELIEASKKEIMDSVHVVETRISKRQTRINSGKKSMDKLDDKLNKYPAKYEKINSDVRAIADDSLAREFSKEFGQH